MNAPSATTLLIAVVMLGVVVGGVAVADAKIIDSAGTANATAGAQNTETPATIIDSANSSNYLSPVAENISQETYAQPALDVSTAVQSDAVRLRGAQTSREFGVALDKNTTAATERQLLRQMATDVQTLEQEYKTLLRQYSDGEIEEKTLFREFVRLGITGQQYRELSEVIQSEGSPSDSVALRLRNLPGEIAVYPSPLISQLETELRSGDGTPMYVQGGDNSLVMGTVVGDTYLRQAMLFSNRDRNATAQFGAGDSSGVNDALDRSKSLYPWALSERGQSDVRGFKTSGVYRVEASHGHGTLRSYLDGGTTNPFFEFQEKNPFAVPATGFSQTTANGLRLSVESTDPTGPMRIDIVETEEKVGNITISVDNSQLTTVDGSRTVWTVQPRGSFKISAETETGDSVSVFIVS